MPSRSGEPPRDREGRRIAQLFRQYRLAGLDRDARRCDLTPILEEDGLEVAESEVSDCGYAACLIRLPGGGGGIMIAGGQDRGRRRFSLAHELGHYHIPAHQQVGAALRCVDADLRRRMTDAARREWEANDFATELLMPARLYRADVADREISFRTVSTLAAPDMYDVSMTAAAWRLVETTREACALVVSVHGEIDWVVRSEAWTYPLSERRRPLPVGSCAAAVTRGEPAHDRPESLDPLTWLVTSDGRWSESAGLELFESTHAIPRLGQVLSLLWVVDADD